MNHRRKLIVALGAGALTTPFGSFAQQQPSTKVTRVGFLATRARPDSLDTDPIGGFPRGMRELGYIEGKNLEMEWRYAESKPERLPGLAAELVRLKVDVIVTNGTVAASAAQKSTSTIPIVMINANDPVASGLVKSLSRPGGNITGLSNIGAELSPKHVEMLLSIVPKLSRVAVLINSANPATSATFKKIQAAVLPPSVTILHLEARTASEIGKAFSATALGKAGAVIVSRDGLFIQEVRQIAELAARNRLPTISAFREYVEAGGLMSYGPNLAEHFRRAASYVDKILKGANPADLPVEQPMKFELLINGKTAKALGLKIPQSLLMMADKVIE